MAGLVQPRLEQILDFCEESPIERVFLEDVARRGLGRFVAVETDDSGREAAAFRGLARRGSARADSRLARRGSLRALCHVGANVVPAGDACGDFAHEVRRANARMIIGAERPVADLWSALETAMPPPREDRPGQPVYVLDEPPEPGGTALRPATAADVDRLVPACAAAHQEELGVDPLDRDSDGFRWRTRAQIEDGRSWVWLEDDVILFKAEASAWTPSAVQLQQVWVDEEVRNRGYAKRGLRDLCRLLLERVPAVCLFVRPENEAAIRVYEGIGMRRVLAYRSLLF